MTSPSGNPHRREEDSLFRAFAADRDPAVRGALAERHLPLVRNLARRYANGYEPMDDLVQVGCIGLLNAIDRFDPDFGTAFSSFAVPTILGEIRRHFRDRTWSMRVPRRLQELAVKIPAAEAELEADLGRSPTAAELAAVLRTDVEELLSARLVAAGYHAVSLDASMDAGDADGLKLSERFRVAEPGFDVVDDAFVESGLLAGLDERTREMLRLYFEQDLTQSQIGERMGVSQMQVSRVLRSAMLQIAGVLDDSPNTASAA